MTGALVILAVTVVAGVILYLTREKEKKEASQSVDDTPSCVTGSSECPSDPSGCPEATAGEDSGEPEVCCGLHEVCRKGLLRKDELYYNDEELDRYKGREPDSYLPSEVEEFREVLYTLRPAEVAAWGAALTQRGIFLPLDLRDEWIMLCDS